MNEIVKCRCCGVEFVRRNKTHAYCSQQCRNARYYMTHRDHVLEEDREQYRLNINGRRDKDIARAKARSGYGGPVPARVCEQCGVVYTPKKNHPENRFCSRACQDKAWDRRSRLTLYAAEREPYRDEDIFVRDKYRCGICGERIRKNLKHPHPQSASIDHIVPLSCGGSDAPYNVQAAHLKCNCAKGNRAANDQLLLVG